MWIGLVKIAGDDELVFDGLHGIEDEIVKELFAHVVPSVFLWVEIGAMRGQFNHRHIIRDIEYAGTVAGRAVIDDEQEMLMKALG